MEAAHEALMSTLADDILALARRAEYIPPGEIPYVPEVEDFGRELVRLVLASIEQDLRRGVHPEAVIRVFSYVFLRTFEAVYRWHRSPEGTVERPVVMGDILQEDYRSGMPEDLEHSLQELPTPALLFDTTSSWILKNREAMEREGVDLWPPLVVALQLTSAVAVSMALKVFGYRE